MLTLPPPIQQCRASLTFVQLYLNNLNPKVPKAKLKESLYQVFSPFGKILDVIAIKTKELRGQVRASV